MTTGTALFAVGWCQPGYGSGLHVGTWDEVAPSVQDMSLLGDVTVRRLDQEDCDDD